MRLQFIHNEAGYSILRLSNGRYLLRLVLQSGRTAVAHMRPINLMHHQKVFILNIYHSRLGCTIMPLPLKANLSSPERDQGLTWFKSFKRLTQNVEH